MRKQNQIIKKINFRSGIATILLYTSLDYNDVKNMTITQYNDLIIAISSKQAFDIQTGAIGFGKENLMIVLIRCIAYKTKRKNLER